MKDSPYRSPRSSSEPTAENINLPESPRRLRIWWGSITIFMGVGAFNLSPELYGNSNLLMSAIGGSFIVAGIGLIVLGVWSQTNTTDRVDSSYD